MRYLEIAKILGYKEENILDIVKPEDFYEEQDIKLAFKILIRINDLDFYHYISDKYYLKIRYQKREEALSNLIVGIEPIPTENFELKYKCGDIVYYDFKVQYITDMIDNRVTGVSDGSGGSSSYNIDVVDITPHSIQASERVSFAYSYIYKYENLLPDNMNIRGDIVYGKLEFLWRNIIENPSSPPDVWRFAENIVEHIKNKNYDLIDIDDDGNAQKLFMERGFVSEKAINC